MDIKNELNVKLQASNDAFEVINSIVDTNIFPIYIFKVDNKLYVDDTKLRQSLYLDNDLMNFCKTIEIRDIYIRIFKKVLDELLNTYYTNKINKGVY